MKKKTILILLATFVMMTATGCGKKTAFTPEPSPAPLPELFEETAVDPVEESVEPIEEPVEEPYNYDWSESFATVRGYYLEGENTEDILLRLRSTPFESMDFDEATGDLQMYFFFEALEVDEPGYDALNSTLEALNSDVAFEVNVQREDLVAFSEDIEPEYAYYPWFENRVNVVMHADDSFLSFWHVIDCYYGGAHGGVVYFGHTYETPTGREMHLSDFFDDLDVVYDFVLNELATCDGAEGFYEDYSDTVYKMIYEIDGYRVNWVYHDGAVDLVFNQYDIAPYAFGTATVTVPLIF